jgi:hypothetical protein
VARDPVAALSPLRPLLPGIGRPTRLVGQSGLLTPPGHARDRATPIPGACLATPQQCGHLLTCKQRRRVNELSIDRLAGL